MGALTPTVSVSTEFAGKYKLIGLTATIASASDTITLTQAETGVTALVMPLGAVITGGADSAFTALQVSVSALTVTIVSMKETGAAADDFTGTTVAISLLGKTSA